VAPSRPTGLNLKMNVVKIERLTTSDEGRLRAIRLRALQDAPDAFGTTLEEASRQPFEVWRRQLEQFAVFVSTTGDRDIGIVRGGGHEDCNGAAYLLSLWVAPEMRRQGIAAALVDSVVAWARTEGFRRLVLDVAESNAAALALYMRKGFVPNGTFGTLPHPRRHIREYQLEKKLEPEPPPAMNDVAGHLEVRRLDDRLMRNLDALDEVRAKADLAKYELNVARVQ